MASAAEVQRNTELIQRDIPAAFWTALKERGLLREDSPVPPKTPR
jgi:hypothetical protein